MKGSRAETARAARIRAAVTFLSAGRPVVSPGARLEELLGFPLDNYPDEIMPLELLPTMDGLEFVGWTADFLPVECRQFLVGDTLMNSAKTPLVGWKPKRMGILTTTIQPDAGTEVR